MKVKVAKNTPDRLFIVLKPYGRFLFVPVAVLFGALAAIAIWSMGSIYTLSAADGVLHYEQRFLMLTKRRTISPWGSRTQIPLADIDGVDVAPFTLTTAKGQTTTSYEVNLRMRAGAPVSIAFGPMFTAESAQETGTLIDGWLSRQPRSRQR
jgi:hypothetical protein